MSFACSIHLQDNESHLGVEQLKVFTQFLSIVVLWLSNQAAA